jgi:hypothetical protein
MTFNSVTVTVRERERERAESGEKVKEWLRKKERKKLGLDNKP